MTDTPEAVIAEAEKLLKHSAQKRREGFTGVPFEHELERFIRNLLDMVEHLRTERDALRAYVQHKPDCEVLPQCKDGGMSINFDAKCTCGLAALQQDVERLNGK